MPRGFLAQEPHKYYPQDWLSEPQALQLLNESGYQFTRLYADFCRKHLELGGSDGERYIRKLSLDQYIERRKFEDAEALL
jgi:hypothetical protein